MAMSSVLSVPEWLFGLTNMPELAIPSRARPSWAPSGPNGPGPNGPGPHGPPWDLMGRAQVGRALMGRALMGPLGHSRPPKSEEETVNPVLLFFIFVLTDNRRLHISINI